MYYYRKRTGVLRKEVKSLKVELKRLYKINQKLEKGQVKECIKDLPLVLACLDAAKREGPHGNRYRIEWIYECLLMRIKSPALYEHTRTQNVLALPCRTTLNSPFCLKFSNKKIYRWSETDVHGSIIIDEMKVPSELDFDRHTLKTIGLVDIGEFTPKEDKTKAGDHILVVMFRPYRGDWYQSLGIFLSKGNVKGPILAKIILEAVGLTEGTGLKVDSISTDAAYWNRNMWTTFNINENKSSMEHPQDESRQLFFFSDWSHAVKCARNMMSPELPQKPKNDGNTTKKRNPRKKFNEKGLEMTPQEVSEGLVKQQHWIALLKEEDDLANRQGVAALTYVPGLNRKTVFPDGFERMNVGMAYKFFSNSVRAGMEFYRKKGVKDLEDSEPTDFFFFALI
ncbi:Transposable element P transposase [Frankliniella fusca]|uniref:Transposable element P transposase n=1 Tax=Frankliniella fusca TaxID=407009 RepID=A0AAE1HLP9_9NEOP|nr:Transposable element P transposase [Frankliniella fusca]